TELKQIVWNNSRIRQIGTPEVPASSQRRAFKRHASIRRTRHGLAERAGAGSGTGTLREPIGNRGVRHSVRRPHIAEKPRRAVLLPPKRAASRCERLS
ncbi:hypothetical protein, partial [Nocardioides glacieisoli]|uniref:hypothetical protein n=1 Tax=Nocardioides glacieisoli TaxID=1168730 RepID=UPI001A91200A